MISNADITQLIPWFPFLAEIPPAIKTRLRAGSTRVILKAGAVVFDVGSACNAFPLISEGSIKVSKVLSDSREIMVYRLQPGESCLLTTSCLLGDSVYPARGLVEQDLRGIAISGAVFHALIEGSQPFRKFVFQSFADRIAELMEFIELVGFGQLDQRLANVLCEKPSTILATHQQLAEEVGSVREVVSRVLKDFEARGILWLGRGKIKIVDRSALFEIAHPFGDRGH